MKYFGWFLLNHSIWNRNNFLKKLKNESPHFFENPSKPNSKNDGLGVYGTKKKALPPPLW